MVLSSDYSYSKICIQKELVLPEFLLVEAQDNLLTILSCFFVISFLATLGSKTLNDTTWNPRGISVYLGPPSDTTLEDWHRKWAPEQSVEEWMEGSS